MDVKLKLRLNPGDMKKIELIGKTPDLGKYNLRCNRNVSEKMMKKDFVYDIRRPIQPAKKFERQKKNVLPAQPGRNKVLEMTDYSTITKNFYNGGNGDASVLPIYRTLKYECNFCHEQIATLFSLSTHVKSHCRKYCNVCYWIFEDGETMKKHFETAHQSASEIAENS